MIALTREEFAQFARGLPTLSRVDLSAKVVHVEPIAPSYFTDASRQRCIVCKDGKLYLADYDGV